MEWSAHNLHSPIQTSSPGYVVPLCEPSPSQEKWSRDEFGYLGSRVRTLYTHQGSLIGMNKVGKDFLAL